MKIKRNWQLFDAKDKILGRLASEISQLLLGKQKPTFLPYLDDGDYVVVVNAAKVRVSGKKEKQKKYYRHSGYPGGLKMETLVDLRARKPTEILRRAVLGMLPKNKLRKERMKRLFIYPGEENPHRAKFQIPNSKS
jgi:large subunit ribosomal protein L13